jgi:integrase
MSVSQDTSAPAADPGCGDKRRLVKTKTPGVFKRIDGSGNVVGYVAVIRVAGRQRKRNARTYEAARRIKRESETDRDRGELQERTKITFLRFLDHWVERYRGQGRRGFRENTRDEYRRLIVAYARPYFSGRLKLVDVTTYDIARFLDWLADESEQGRRLADSTVANIVNPLRAALATAKREGLIRHNPAQGLALPHREQISDEEDEVKIFSREQLAAVLAMAPECHEPLFELLASSGLRISEAIALQRLHLQLDADEPEVLRSPGNRPRTHRAAKEQARPPRGPPTGTVGSQAARAPRRPARSGFDCPRLPQRKRQPARPQQPPPPRPQAARG